MSDNSQKTPLSSSLPQFTEKKINDAIQQLGRALPATVVSRMGQIVTVKFDLISKFTLPQVTMPMAVSEYVRLPVQAGCRGVVFPVDVALGGQSGLGSGTAGTVQPANLSSLVFFPIARTSFTSVDTNDLVLYGEPAVKIMDKTHAATFHITPTGFTFTIGGCTVTINASGLHITGGVLDVDGLNFGTHHHIGVQPGSGESGPPVPG